MITLTVQVAFSSFNRMRVAQVAIDHLNSIANVTMQVQQANGNAPVMMVIQVRNGSCVGLRANATPTGINDVIQSFTTTPAGTPFTTLAAAYLNGAGSLAAKAQAVESALQTAGLLPAGTVS